MPSPIKPSDICGLIVNAGDLLCDKFKAFLNLPRRLCAFWTWAFNADGTVSVAFKKEFSSIGLPIGMPQHWPYSTIPSGFVVLNGQAISRTTYAEYFLLCGTTFGAGDGITTFNVPDYQGRVPMGASGAYAVGSTGGFAEHTLTLAQLPTDHTDYRVESSGSGDIFGSDVIQGDSGTGPQSGTLTTGPNGGGQPHNNLQPYLAGYWIARVETL